MEPRWSKRYTRLPARQRRLVSVVLGGYGLLLLNSLLLLLFDESTAMAYMSLVLLHVGLGLLLIGPVAVFLVMHVRKMPLRFNRAATVAGVGTAVAVVTLLVTGIVLTVAGSTVAGGWMLYGHIGAAVVAILGFGTHISLKRGVRFHFLELGDRWKTDKTLALQHPLSVTLLAGGGITLLILLLPLLTMQRGLEVATPYDEHPLGAGQALLAHEGFLADDDLARSETCGQAGCHPDVYAQWQESVHRFSSFNNPYYRKSVETMLARSGPEATRWCASCHDPVVLFSGRFGHETPVDTDHWTAHEGLTCLSCHAVEGLRDVRGNGRFVIAKPDEYPFARAEEGVGRWLHNKLVRTKPEPHRQAMLKPVHQTQEFCGTCHKVGLPPEVNNYKWRRGQNEYDAWHASGASGNTVRSFYLPKEPTTCTSCHMPLVPSDDQGNDGGFVRSHRFASANTALPYINDHPDQLTAVQRALQDSIVTVDLFGVEVNGRVYGPEAPMPVLQAGDDVALSVVVRNRKVGHGFPGGTNDSNEFWLELVGQNGADETILASGLIDADGRVDTTAHFWGAVLVDRASQLIDKRNAQDWIATVYANVIGPGTAHVVHYRFEVPPGTAITSFRAALQHRKFKWYFNEWTFRGHVAAGEPDSLGRPEVDRRRWVLGDGEAPDLPVTLIAETQREAGQPYATGRPLWERWNDYGIGLFVQGATREALPAFGRVAELAPESPEGPINEARVLLDEGQLDRAEAALQEAEVRQPGYLKTAYFRGVWYKANGLYDEAIDEWMAVYDAYPLDRVLLLGIGRLHYLSGRYEEALAWHDRVLDIDPEDLGGLYNRMLTLGALDRPDAFAEAQRRYEYHKDNEDEQAVAAPYKQQHPYDNREAQAIHEHELHPVVQGRLMVPTRVVREGRPAVRAGTPLRPLRAGRR